MDEMDAAPTSWHSNDRRPGVAYGVIIAGLIAMWVAFDNITNDLQLDDYGKPATAWVESVEQSEDGSSEVSLELHYDLHGERQDAAFYVPRGYIDEGPLGCPVPVSGQGALRLYPAPDLDDEARRARFDRQCPDDADYATYVPWEVKIVHLESNTRIVKPTGWGRGYDPVETASLFFGGLVVSPVFAFFYFRTPRARRREELDDDWSA